MRHGLIWIFVFTTLLFGRPALAFSGNWVGKGVIKDTKDLFSGKCSKLEVVTERTAKKLILKSFVYKCGLIDSDWIGLEFDINGETLLDPETGETMGKISQNEILLVYQSGTLETLNLQLTAEQTLRLVFNTQNLMGNILIQGELLTKQY